jgi:hypothetical protein
MDISGKCAEQLLQCKEASEHRSDHHPRKRSILLAGMKTTPRLPSPALTVRRQAGPLQFMEGQKTSLEAH